MEGNTTWVTSQGHLGSSNVSFSREGRWGEIQHLSHLRCPRQGPAGPNWLLPANLNTSTRCHHPSKDVTKTCRAGNWAGISPAAAFQDSRMRGLRELLVLQAPSHHKRVWQLPTSPASPSLRWAWWALWCWGSQEFRGFWSPPSRPRPREAVLNSTLALLRVQESVTACHTYGSGFLWKDRSCRRVAGTVSRPGRSSAQLCPVFV